MLLNDVCECVGLMGMGIEASGCIWKNMNGEWKKYSIQLFNLELEFEDII